MQKTETVEVPIFPLNTVLFPGGLLPLKIFEQRYLDMTRDCLRDGTPFGVFLIREGSEVGTPASCEEVGCLASISQWEMPQLSIFHLLVEGRGKVRIREKRAEANGLIRGEVELRPEESPIPLSPQFQRYAEVLRMIIKKAGGQFFPQPQRYDDAVWVGYRLAEVLPIALSARQTLLTLADSHERIRLIHQALEQQGFAV